MKMKQLTVNEVIKMICPKLAKNYESAITHVFSGLPKLTLVNK